MGRDYDVLGLNSAPIIGATYYHPDECNCGPNTAKGLPLVPFEQIKTEGNFFRYREKGVHRLWQTRAISAQTRMKNEQYELPSGIWTENVEGPAYIVRVPGIPTRIGYMQQMNTTSVFHEPLSPIANLQIQNTETWFARLRSAVLGHFVNEQNPNASLAVMFPSVFNSGE